MWGYPLALADAKQPIQVLRQNNGQPINPSVDLCAKGNYHIDSTLLREQIYPLSFNISVLYLRDTRNEPKYIIGSKFADILLTQEGQRLLSRTNLTPYHPIEKD